MDKIKAVHGYAVSWVAAHPTATVNVILVSAALKLAAAFL